MAPQARLRASPTRYGAGVNPGTPRIRACAFAQSPIRATAPHARRGHQMIIDCHGHYTTEPKDLHRFRKDQTEAVKNKTALPLRAGLKMSDDEIRESLEQ